MIENRIAEVLRERFSEEDLNECFLVKVTCLPGNKIIVYVEADGQLTIKMCQRISRFLEKKIEENGWLPEKYTLDVSSPGTDNPLLLLRQYKKNIGRNAAVRIKEDERIEGKLIAVDEEFIIIEDSNNGHRTIPFEIIIETKILVSLK